MTTNKDSFSQMERALRLIVTLLLFFVFYHFYDNFLIEYSGISLGVFMTFVAILILIELYFSFFFSKYLKETTNSDYPFVLIYYPFLILNVILTYGIATIFVKICYLIGMNLDQITLFRHTICIRYWTLDELRSKLDWLNFKYNLHLSTEQQNEILATATNFVDLINSLKLDLADQATFFDFFCNLSAFFQSESVFVELSLGGLLISIVSALVYSTYTVIRAPFALYHWLFPAKPDKPLPGFALEPLLLKMRLNHPERFQEMGGFINDLEKNFTEKNLCFNTKETLLIAFNQARATRPNDLRQYLQHIHVYPYSNNKLFASALLEFEMFTQRSYLRDLDNQAKLNNLVHRTLYQERFWNKTPNFPTEKAAALNYVAQMKLILLSGAGEHRASLAAQLDASHIYRYMHSYTDFVGTFAHGDLINVYRRIRDLPIINFEKVIAEFPEVRIPNSPFTFIPYDFAKWPVCYYPPKSFLIESTADKVKRSILHAGQHNQPLYQQLVTAARQLQTEQLDRASLLLEKNTLGFEIQSYLTDRVGYFREFQDRTRQEDYNLLYHDWMIETIQDFEKHNLMFSEHSIFALEELQAYIEFNHAYPITVHDDYFLTRHDQFMSDLDNFHVHIGRLIEFDKSVAAYRANFIELLLQTNPEELDYAAVSRLDLNIHLFNYHKVIDPIPPFIDSVE